MMEKRQPLLSLSVLACLMLSVACQQERLDPAPTVQPAARLQDLTHGFDETTIYWPTAEGFRLHRDARGMTGKGYFYTANSFASAEHGGTHLDAPVHFAEQGWTTDQIPLENLVGPAVRIDVSEKCLADRDYQIRIQDVEGWEQQHGPIPDRAILLFFTGFGRHWPDPEAYLGTAERGPEAVSLLHFPGLHPDTAEWLTKRGIRAVGLDTASIDYGQSQLYESHRTLFAANIPAFENVANLGTLPDRNFQVFALPMKIAGGSGGPLRIIAVIPPAR